MNIIKSILALALVAVAVTITAPVVTAAEQGIWAGVGNGTGTLSWAVVPHTGKASPASTPPAQPLLTYLNATSDSSTGKVQFYNAGRPAFCSSTNLGVTNFVSITNAMTLAASGFNTNAGVILIYHKSSGLFDRRILAGSSSGSHLVTTVATTNGVGDIIWPMATTGNIPVGVATKELNGPGIYASDPGEPLMFEITGGTNSSINGACARFYSSDP